MQLMFARRLTLVIILTLSLSVTMVTAAGNPGLDPAEHNRAVTLTPTTTSVPAAPTAWSLYDPYDSSQPKLITKNGTAYRLQPDWAVDRAEYVYKWWGLSPKPVFDYQILSLGNTGYTIGSQKIDPALVKSLVSAISNLKPVSSILAGQDHTDDYPLWHLELTRKDDQRIVLVSFSTANPGAAPWNIVYNGRIYAQFDGSLGEAIGKVFKSEGGIPAAAFFPGGREEGTVVFGTTGLPAQISVGFVGLMPIADSFNYQVDRAKLQIKGYIEGRSSVGGFGNMVIGTITNLVGVDLFLDRKTATQCPFVSVSSSDPSSAAWTFTCPLSIAALNETYDYPIKITFGTDAGQQAITEGRLRGKFIDEKTILHLPPIEVQSLLATNPAGADILTDHILAFASYDASLVASTSTMRTMSGEAIFLGQTRIGNKLVRYTLGTPFGIENDKLTHWTLTRAGLQKMLANIVDLPLTKRIYAQAPEVTLNLWYAERDDVPRVEGLLNNNFTFYKADLTACDSTAVKTLPGTDAFQAFGFGGRWYLSQPDFLLVKNQPVVYGLFLRPERDPREGAMRLLVPRQLDWGAGKPFSWIGLDRFGANLTLSLSIGDPSDSATVAALRKLVTALPGKANFSYETIWEVSNVTIRVAADGGLEVVACPK